MRINAETCITALPLVTCQYEVEQLALLTADPFFPWLAECSKLSLSCSITLISSSCELKDSYVLVSVLWPASSVQLVHSLSRLLSIILFIFIILFFFSLHPYSSFLFIFFFFSLPSLTLTFFEYAMIYVWPWI